jgi:hypothetical protein
MTETGQTDIDLHRWVSQAAALAHALASAREYIARLEEANRELRRALESSTLPHDDDSGS